LVEPPAGPGGASVNALPRGPGARPVRRMHTIRSLQRETCVLQAIAGTDAGGRRKDG
jgi:hypothetical protein